MAVSIIIKHIDWFCQVCLKTTDHIIFKDGKRHKKQCTKCNVITGY